ncbi:MULTISPECIES: LrgB family protein [Micrococcus]|uniref:LrgB family protein n=1 Tax=Micrococcus TaxID=1269 RepID=UPI00119FD874|nr:LrgB family protein [Micrococcus luteus]MCV7516044.1 LrgB family protein [Micrococcus luteus]
MNAADLTDSLAEAWDALLHTPLFGIALTLAVAVLSRRLWLAARQTALLTPVLVTIVLVAAFLALTGIDYETYMIGGSYLTFLLGPATVALAVPLYRAGPDIRKLLLPIAVGVTVGSLTAMVSAVLIVRAMGGDAALAATFAPKSATTPIAMAVADAGGGIVSLAAVLPVLTGVLGAVFAPWLLDRLRVRDPRVRGLAIGVSSHGIGTARALAEGPKTGAFSALAMACSGLLTALLAPLVLAMTG